MGKTLELLGLATFNIFVAIALSAAFMSKAETIKSASVDRLTEENVKEFILEVTAISSGQREDMDTFSITEYFMKHINDNSFFESTVNLESPNKMPQTREVKVDKATFISQVIKGQKDMKDYETKVVIEYVEINNNSDEAQVITTSYERGLMPYNDNSGNVTKVPVNGTSYCEQNLVLKENAIKMAGARCTTDMIFARSF